MHLRVTGLFYYPIKSCKGISVNEAEIDPTGFKNDRLLMLVDDHGRFLTQRKIPRMALITPRLADDRLTLSAPGMDERTFALQSSGKEPDVRVWKDTLKAVDQGAMPAEWFSDFLGTGCRLVRMTNRHIRPLPPKHTISSDARVSFADGFPFLLTAEESLDDLNRRLEVPVSMERFRPNIVISGLPPYAEDRLTAIQIGTVTFTIAKPCARCVITTIDPETGRQGVEPLRTLSTYRLKKNKVLFGQNLIHRNRGTVSLEDTVHIII